MINKYFDSPLFKHPHLINEFWDLSPKAKYLMMKLNYVSVEQFGKCILVTCIYYKGGSGIHREYRAFDIRTKDWYTKDQITWLQAHFNFNFPYDPARPRFETLRYHIVNKKKIKDYKLKDFVPEYHLHCQVYVK